MNYRPKKQLGQNFLNDKSVIDNIIIKGGITRSDTVLEIGSGQGALTYALCKNAKKVIAVEKDSGLARYLDDKFKSLKNLEIINDDILEFLESRIINHELREKPYKVVGNIPYYLTSHLIRELLALKNKPSEIILMIQKEVAERTVAKAGDMNLLAISVQLFAEPEILFAVSKNSFWPKPKVDSAVIKLKVKSEKLNINEESFFEIVKAGFSTKRKLLINNLAKGLGIPKEKICAIFKSLGISENARAQDLAVEDWMKIYKNINV